MPWKPKPLSPIECVEALEAAKTLQGRVGRPTAVQEQETLRERLGFDFVKQGFQPVPRALVERTHTFKPTWVRHIGEGVSFALGPEEERLFENDLPRAGDAQ